MKKLVAALILGGITVMTPIADGTAWASKNCPPGSHKGSLTTGEPGFDQPPDAVRVALLRGAWGAVDIDTHRRAVRRLHPPVRGSPPEFLWNPRNLCQVSVDPRRAPRA